MSYTIEVQDDAGWSIAGAVNGSALLAKRILRQLSRIFAPRPVRLRADNGAEVQSIYWTE